MVRDPDDAVTAGSEPAPPMLGRPADAPPPLDRLGESEAVGTFRRTWSLQKTGGTSLRAWAGRVSGRSDRHLLRTVADATETTAAHVDRMVDRLNAQEAVTSDVAGALGQEIALLRAEVMELRRSLGTLREPGP
jgi:hypothetical protein